MPGTKVVQVISIVSLLILSSSIFPIVVNGTSGTPPWWPTQGEWVETQVLQPSDVEVTTSRLNFGARVAADGDLLLVGTQSDFHGDKAFCPYGDDGCDWVYVFERNSEGQWVEIQKLVPSDAQTWDSFGASLAVDEESGIIVVGNPAFRTQANKMYIFERQTNGEWIETALFDWGREVHAYGYSVAVDGTTVAVVGGTREDDVYERWTHVFDKNDGEWVESAVLRGGDGAALVGDTLVNRYGPREPYECAPNGGKRGIYQIFNRVDGEWILAATIDPQTEFGNRTQTTGTNHRLSPDGKTLVISAAVDRRVYGIHTEHCIYTTGPEPIGNISVHEKNGALGAVGSAWVYEQVDETWVLTADLSNPMPNLLDHDGFAWNVALTNDLIIVGNPLDMYNSGTSSGAIYVYGRHLDSWQMVAKLRNHDSDGADWFGWSVTITGTTIIAGADWNTLVGTVHVFEKMDLPFLVMKRGEEVERGI